MVMQFPIAGGSGADLSAADVAAMARDVLASGNLTMLPALLSAADRHAALWESEEGQVILVGLLQLLIDTLDAGRAPDALAAMAPCPPRLAQEAHDLFLAAFGRDGRLDTADLDDAALLCLALLTGASGRGAEVAPFLASAGAGRAAEGFARSAAAIAARFAPAQAKPAIKLNIGAADKRRPGFLSVDIRADSGADIISTAWELTGVPDGCVDEIYSRHMLEHLDPNDARRTLAKWLTVLRPGGRLNLIVPDLEFHARQLLGAAKSHFPDQMQHALASIYGWRDERHGGSREDVHRWGYTCQTLIAELKQAGFVGMTRLLSDVPDTEPWHLNLLATRPE
jgi:SAM-dependent methyltransferase